MHRRFIPSGRRFNAEPNFNSSRVVYSKMHCRLKPSSIIFKTKIDLVRGVKSLGVLFSSAQFNAASN